MSGGEGELEAVPADVTYDHLRQLLAGIANARDDWAGIPMPLEGQQLAIEPRFPHAKFLQGVTQAKDEPPPGDVRIRNRWYSRRLRCEVVVYEEAGRVRVAMLPSNQVECDLKTMDAARAWGLEQEARALSLLDTLISDHAMHSYVLAGSFLETSRRSGITYLFRRLRPTVAIAAEAEGFSRVLACLCLHPIGYYTESWAGAMCPTDDVVAHLMLMRGDEHLFWKRSSQHPPWMPQAGM